MPPALSIPRPAIDTIGRGDDRPAQHPRSPLLATALQDVVALMRRDPAVEFHTATAAARLDLPSFAFIRAFKQLTGLSPQRFHAALRIELAKRLAVETDRSVTEISFDAGYNSLGTFVRTFTALVGVSPGQLRRLARGDTAVIDELAAGLPAEPPSREAAGIRATIDAPVPGASILAAGLFPQGLPAGLPFDGCFVDPADPVFRLAWPPGRRRASLLVAAIGAFSIRHAWAGRLEGVRVCSLRLTALPCPPSAAPLRLRLRPLKETDPPFLTPVPLLMLLQARRRP